MILTVEKLARLMDVSCVRTDVTVDEIKRLADLVKRYNCVCGFVLPCYAPEFKKFVSGAPDVGVGSVVGFPAGANTTSIKKIEARELREKGVDEIDMVMNVGMLLSGCDDYVREDMQAVVEAAGGLPVKVILETHYLDAEQIVRACTCATAAGISYVKTATGWTPTGATIENVSIMKDAVGDAVKVKAAGGVRDLETVTAMLRIGVSRFGVSMTSAETLLTELAAKPGGRIEISDE